MKSAVLAVALVLSSTAVSAQDTHWYVGVSGGQSKGKVDTAAAEQALAANAQSHTGFSTEETDSSYKLFFGYRLTPNFGIEVGYADLGDFSATTTVTTGPAPPRERAFRVTWEHGITVTPVGSFYFGEHFAILGKAGLYYAKTTGSFSLGGFPVGSSNGSDSNTGLIVGAGLGYDFLKNFGIRAEWERFFDAGGDHTGGKIDFDLMSLGFVVRF